jgi:copper(I)-binding protein
MQRTFNPSKGCMLMRRITAVFATCAIVLAASACDHQPAAAPASEATASAAPDAKPGAQITAGRLVLPAVNGNPAAAYFTVRNTGATPIAIAAVAVDGATKAEMHQTSGGQMRAVETAQIAPGASLEFAPGGYHVMLFALNPKLTVGGIAELTVTFADGDKVSAPLKIEATGGGAMNDMGAMHMDDHH